jgi:hypothetical protein
VKVWCKRAHSLSRGERVLLFSVTGIQLKQLRANLCPFTDCWHYEKAD